MRKNSIHKKVMATAKELEGGLEFYDRNESLRAAIRQRQFLLNRLVYLKKQYNVTPYNMKPHTTSVFEKHGFSLLILCKKKTLYNTN